MTNHFVQADVLVPMREDEAEIALTMALHLKRLVQELSGRFGESRDARDAQQTFHAGASMIALTVKEQHARTLKPVCVEMLQSYLESMVDFGINLPANLSVHRTPGGAPLGLRLSDQHAFSDEATGYLLHVLVCEFDLPPQGFTYARTSGELGFDHFGGGAVYVSRHGIRFQDADNFLYNAKQEDSLDLPAAAHQGNLFRLDHLLGEGADPNMEDGLALKWAARAKKSNTFERLLEAGGHPDTPGLDDMVKGEAAMEATLQAARMKRAIQSETIEAPSITRRSI